MAESSLAVVPQVRQLAQPETFAPRTIGEAMEFAKMVLDSGFAPKAFQGKSPASVVVALQLGMELGLQPMQALQSIALINNTPSVFGDTALALIKSCPSFESIQESIDENTMTATCTVKRRGEPTVTRVFSKADAATAGLWGKAGPWTQYPKRMLQMRARSFAIRDQFPDVLKGIATAEEAQDYPGETIDGAPVTPASVASPAAAAEKPEETIGQAGGSEFYKVYKSNGWTPDEAKKFLAETFQIGPPHNDKNSKDIPASRKAEALKWASTKAPVYESVVKKFNDLGWTVEEQIQFVNARKVNYPEIDKELDQILAKKDAQERGE